MGGFGFIIQLYFGGGFVWVVIVCFGFFKFFFNGLYEFFFNKVDSFLYGIFFVEMLFLELKDSVLVEESNGILEEKQVFE